MRSRATIFNVVLYTSNALLCMSQPVKKENNNQQNSLDQHSVRLHRDVLPIIMSHVLNKKITSRIPSFDAIFLGRFDNLRDFDYQLSENWNKPAVLTDDRPQKPLYAYMRGFKDSKTQSTLRIRYSGNDREHFFRIIHDNDELTTRGDYCFEGPNEEDIVLVNKNTQHPNCCTTSYLISLPGIFETHNKLYYQNSSIFGHKRCSLALASKKMYAIASVFPKAHRHCRGWLSWFTFDQNGKTSLADQKMLSIPLKKIVFLINSTLMGLTTDGKILLFWPSKNNKIQSAQQKIPYHVLDFATDPIQKGLVVLALQNNERTELACADVRHKNSSGHILFQFLECESEKRWQYPFENNHIRYKNSCMPWDISDPVDILKLYDSIIYLSERMFQVLPTARLRKALCSKSN